MLATVTRLRSVLRRPPVVRYPATLHTHYVRYNSASAAPPAAADDERPDVFYHLLHTSPPRIALSLLPSPPPPETVTVLGWLPAEPDAALSDFTENPRFHAVLHDAVRDALARGVDPQVSAAAVQTQTGWMHIHDERNVPALGRIGDPDDILASVRVEDGEILPATYSPMPAYRLVTADGPIRLTAGLASHLRAALAARAAVESGEK